MPQFTDWAGEKIAYKTTKDVNDDGRTEWWCYIDPHNVDEWSAFGRGKTAAQALNRARSQWNLYDRQP